jgi:hypothetical protein
MCENNEKQTAKCKCFSRGSHVESIYSLGVIGAAFYFLRNATTFMAVVIGLGKSAFWPAVIIYKVLELLQL